MLRLSNMTDYAVVVLSELAKQHGDVCSAQDMSLRTGLPEPTVAKVLKTLAKEKLITSRRGVAGGYLLEREPREIPVSYIIVALNGPIALTSCVDGGDGDCMARSVCPVQGHWEKVNRRVRDALASMTLAEMISDVPMLDAEGVA